MKRRSIDEGLAYEFAKARRASRRAVPVSGVVTLFALWFFWYSPGFSTGILLFLTAFPLVGDLVNIGYCTWKLRRISSSKNPSP